MAAASTPPSTPRRSRAVPWRIPPLLAGVCFGLGYAVVQRLLSIEFPRLVQLGQAFEVREFPGTTLDALKLKVGAEVQSIRGDLGVLELEAEENKAQVPPREPPLEPAPLIRPLPAEQQGFSDPLDAVPDLDAARDPEPLQPSPVLEEAPPELPDQSTP